MEFSGLILGNVTVAPHVTLELMGMIVGELQVERSSNVRLRGMVDGNVENRGGHLEVWGTVTGKIFRKKGATIVHPEAFVKLKD